MSELISPSPDNTLDVTALLGDLRRMINEARERAAVAVNRELTLMHWHIGDRIRRDILQEERAAYGERIVATLSRHCRDNWSASLDEALAVPIYCG